MDFVYPMIWQTEGYVTQGLTLYDKVKQTPDTSQTYL
jgi:hypothetical protein